jgi:hypothetical protein
MSLTHCRFYEEKYPEIDSFVMVNVKQVSRVQAKNTFVPVIQRADQGFLRTYRSRIWVPTSSSSSTMTSTA